MRIGTYNVYGFRGYPKEESAKRIGLAGSDDNAAHYTRVLAELSCDILGLQEGVFAGDMKKIARPMQCYLATFPSPTACPGHVVSRYPILESRVFSHFDPTESFPPFSRTTGAALLEVGEADATLWFVVLHLYHRTREMRDREADILRDRLNDLLQTTDKAVVLGDFNCEVDERVHQHLREMAFVNAMESAGGGLQVTIDTVGTTNRRAIDHIYVSPSLAPRLKRAEVVRSDGFRHDGPQVDGVWVHSDHLPVVAELDWP